MSYSIFIVFLPFLGASCAGFGGTFLGRKGSCVLTISCLGLS